MKYISADNAHEADGTDALAYATQIAGISAGDYMQPESALVVSKDRTHRAEIQAAIQHLIGARHVLLIGIGGSSLGTEAVYRALAGADSPTLHVFDVIDTEALDDLSRITTQVRDKNELAIVVVSKSGNTTETVTNAVCVLTALEEEYGAQIAERTVFVGTDGTDFLRIGNERGVATVPIPEAIPGRFSVFTAAGVVPLTLLSIDIEALHRGAAAALSEEYRAGAAHHAAVLAKQAAAGTHTVTFFTFEVRLRTLGYWFRQLLAESVGKKTTRNGTPFACPLLPTVASAADLHSMAQLYLSGYTGIFTHFVCADGGARGDALTDHWLLETNEYIDGHTPQEITSAIRTAVFEAYQERELPHRITELSGITGEEVGLFMSSLMLEVMCFAHVCDINAFDQPDVESYKSVTRTLLTR